MHCFLLPIPEFPSLGGCKRRHVSGLTLSPWRVERYGTVRAHMGNALSKIKQNQNDKKTIPALQQNQANPCCCHTHAGHRKQDVTNRSHGSELASH